MTEETFTDASARIARAMSDRVMAAKVADVRAQMAKEDIERMRPALDRLTAWSLADDADDIDDMLRGHRAEANRDLL